MHVERERGREVAAFGSSPSTAAATTACFKVRSHLWRRSGVQTGCVSYIVRCETNQKLHESHSRCARQRTARQSFWGRGAITTLVRVFYERRWRSRVIMLFSSSCLHSCPYTNSIIGRQAWRWLKKVFTFLSDINYFIKCRAHIKSMFGPLVKMSIYVTDTC